MPLVRRTRATLRSAELGFFGVCVNTRTHTPRFCGLTWSAGLFVFVTIFSRPWRTSWLIVGIYPVSTCRTHKTAERGGQLRPAGPRRRKPHAPDDSMPSAEACAARCPEPEGTVLRWPSSHGGPAWHPGRMTLSL